MRVAVVILNWNTRDFLKKFLPGLIASVKEVDGAEVIVADNASSDGSDELMQRDFPDVRLIRSDSNLGFTGGYNMAFNRIYDPAEDSPEYFVLINSDIEVTEGWLKPLTDWMDTHPECGACAPKLHSWQERDKFEYAGAAGGYIDRFGYPFCRGRIMKRLETDSGQYDTPEDVFWATGACLMVRSRTYHMLGGLDDRFFAHMEEIDLCWRMQLNGWKVSVIPDSVVYHVGGGTLPATSPFKLYLNYRNNLLMLENNLAHTFALHRFRSGMTAEDAARMGMRKAERRIFMRKCLDILSSSVYLLTLKTECFKAVWKAHNDSKRLSHRPTKAQIQEYLMHNGAKADVKGIYRKWIILRSVLKGKGVFASIDKRDFYNHT